ncbi:hypothetical protein A8C32_09785 [Flavivirga aquatica]|uniref:DUF3575 domain-containing protein n=1 Tax=Flavivirga aquatica TaxID=1849968 RepID=A0A1E5TEJ0_9FLAO|nr:hypothetical protein [Flavivirga aquatica]OEK09793.1 hypothetical protein A8C32_09785 [Flavivirga aquatica]
MKQTAIKFVMLSFLISSSIYAQETKDTSAKKHELSFDLLELITRNKFELSYRYLLNKSNSIGSNISFSPDKKSLWKAQKFQENFTLDINYQHYFSKKYAQGFYLQAFTEYSSGKSFIENNYNPDNFKKYNALGLGAGMGYKHVFKKGFFIDADIKFTGNLVNSLENNSAYYFPEAKAFIGFSVGKRF